MRRSGESSFWMMICNVDKYDLRDQAVKIHIYIYIYIDKDKYVKERGHGLTASHELRLGRTQLETL
jgi:hypothetical protein